ncbi:MFS transporter [Cryptosporangium japonicum]
MSKIAQPLHFARADALVAFGVGYAVMAVVGGFAFAWGAVADRIGGLNAVRLGAGAYAVGIAGRIFTDVGPSVAFSALAGAGASMALVGIRPWIRSRLSDSEIPRVVGARNLGNQIGVFAGTLGAAGIFAFAPHGDSGTRGALLIAPLLVVAGVVWLTSAAPTRALPPAVVEADAPPSRQQYQVLSAKLAVIGVLSGFYVSLVTPYLPVILVRSGLPEAGVAVLVAAMSAAQIGVTAVLTHRGTRERPFGLFLVAEATTGVLTLAVGLAIGFSVVVVAVLLVLRAGFVAVAITAEETVQYAVIPANAVGLVFGISQTAFLIGDALGGAAGGTLWAVIGPTGLVTIAGLATLLNAVLLPTLLRPRTLVASVAH